MKKERKETTADNTHMDVAPSTPTPISYNQCLGESIVLSFPALLDPPVRRLIPATRPDFFLLLTTHQNAPKMEVHFGLE